MKGVTMATVTVARADRFASYPWLITCDECDFAQYRSTREAARTQARQHRACSECGGAYWDSAERRWLTRTTHCESPCTECLGHCQEYCVNCLEHASERCGECGECRDCQSRCDCGECSCYCDGDHSCDCGECGGGDFESLPGVNYYSYRPNPIFHTDDESTRLFVGLELEVSWEDYDGARDWLSNWAQSTDVLYVKADSSVRNGFEVVTHPMETRWALQGGFPFDAITEALDAGAIPDHDSCGTHIHISREPLTGKQWWTLFTIHRRFKNLCGHVGGRGTGSEWARWSDQEEALANPIPFKLKKESDYPSYRPRYVPINTNPDETVELRYPAGDFTVEGVKRNLQWVEALTTFGQNLSGPSLNEALQTEEPFLNYIADRQWPELQARVASFAG